MPRFATGFIILAALSFPLSLPCRAASFEKVWGTPQDDFISDVARTADGGCVVAGAEAYSGNPLGGSGYLARFHAAGDTLWTRHAEGFDAVQLRSLSLLADGGIATVGTGRDAGDVQHGYLLRTDADGHPLWTKTFGGNSDCVPRRIRELADQSLLISGHRMTVAAGWDLFVLHLDAQGDTLAERTLGTPDFDQGPGMVVLDNGAIVLAGYTDPGRNGASAADLPIPRPNSELDREWSTEQGYIICLDSDLSTLWEEIVPYERYLRFEAVESAGSSRALAGGLKHIADAPYNDDYIFAMIDATSGGGIEWLRASDRPFDEVCWFLRAAGGDLYFAAGNAHWMDPVPADAALSLIDVDGEILATQTYGGANWDEIYAATTAAGREYYAGGYTASQGAGGADFLFVRDEFPPFADFTATPRQGTPPLTAFFQDISNFAASSWEWDLDGDGLTDSQAQNPSFEYPTIGSYSVTLTATFGASVYTRTKVDYVMVRPDYLIDPAGGGDLPTIQAAIDAAFAGDVIGLADGIFTGAGNTNLDFHGKAIELRSMSGDPATCIIDCENIQNRRGFHFSSAETPASIIEGITIKRGYPVSPGGGMLLEGGASPTIRRCVFLQNRSQSTGGAIHAQDNCAAQILDCTFDGNSLVVGSDGGALYIHSAGALISGCTFQGNYAGGCGGAAMFVGQAVELRECTFIENSAPGCAGAVYTQCASNVFDRCMFAENTSDLAGACIVWYQATFQDCTFLGNTANVYGALACGLAASTEISGCTFVDNDGALASSIYFTSNTQGTIHNSILAFGRDGRAVDCDNGVILNVACSDVFGNEGGDWVDCLSAFAGQSGNMAADPLFCDLAAGDLTLHLDSPCAAENNPGCGRIGAWTSNCEPFDFGVCCVGNDCFLSSEGECHLAGGRFRHIWDSCDGDPCATWVRADFAAAPLVGVAPLQVQFTDLSANGPTSWSWDFDADGDIDNTSQSPIHTYANPGLYGVTLTVTNAQTEDSLTKSHFITVLAENTMIVHATEITSEDPTGVPVEYAGVDPLGAISLYFDYDDSKLAYAGLESHVPGEIFSGGVIGDRITVQWFDETGGLDPIIPGADADTLFAIRFTNLVSADSTQVLFDESNCVLADPNGDPLAGVFWLDEPPYGVVLINIGSIVSGDVEYYWQARPVPNANLTMSPLPLEASTDATGHYLLASVPYGNYVLNIDKTDDLGGINSLDAIKVIRHSTGQEPLGNPFKLIAADVNGIPGINALDAIKIVRAAVGLEPLASGDWTFVPESVVYAPLNTDQIADFTGIRMGDVNGDWEPSGRNDGAGSELRDVIALAFPDTTVSTTAGLIELPLRVENFSGIGAVSLRIAFADSVIQFENVISHAPGVSFTFNLVGEEIRIEWFDPTGGLNPIMIGAATLLGVEFTLVGEDDDVSPLDFTADCAIGDAIGDPIAAVTYQDGSCTLHSGTGVDDPLMPAFFKVEQNFPNPFNPTTELRFSLPSAAEVSAQVYDLAGRRVRVLLKNTAYPAGVHSLSWDGRDNSGRPISSGVYLLRLESGGRTATVKMLMTK